MSLSRMVVCTRNRLRFSRATIISVWGVVAYLSRISEPAWPIAYIPPITPVEIAETARKAKAGDAGAENLRATSSGPRL